MFEVKVARKFSAAHMLPDYPGACARLHGHTWKVVVYLRVADVGPGGMTVDFVDVKKMIDAVLPDHRYLGGGPVGTTDGTDEGLLDTPTAENLAKYLFAKLSMGILEAYLLAVEVYESEDCSVIYYAN